jgi:CheY-like chemotaxis protein
MEGDREKCIEAGMNDYIGKPVVEADLKKTLARWIS